jgi:hypothetical protein
MGGGQTGRSNTQSDSAANARPSEVTPWPPSFNSAATAVSQLALSWPLLGNAVMVLDIIATRVIEKAAARRLEGMRFLCRSEETRFLRVEATAFLPSSVRSFRPDMMHFPAQK